MKETEPVRLLRAGTEEERRLLRAGQEVRVPESLQTEVRRAVEARARRSKKGWALLGGAGLLLAAAAAALPLMGRRHPRVSQPAAHGPVHPVVVGMAPPPPAPRPIASPSHLAPVRHEAPAPAASPAPTLQPGLDLPGFRHPGVEPRSTPPPSAPARARLLIARSDRRDVDLEVTATTVRGQVRGRLVALTVSGQDLSGRIGDDQVTIHIFANRRAEGSVGGREVEFVFTPTDDGWLVHAALPDLAGRVRLEQGRLSFSGCDNELAAVAGHPGSFRGSCTDDTQARIELPTPFLTPMARLVVLGMLLPEPEAVLRGRVPGLFPPP